MVRVRWGGSLLEEARLHGSPKLLTVAPARRRGRPGRGRRGRGRGRADRCGGLGGGLGARARRSPPGVSLVDADVVVSGGRGVGSAEGFSVIEELAALLGGAVGCSRAVTSAGWRPHTDQVGQTGTKISPEIYIACGISGATQHMAGCKGAKKLLAINPDGEASIFASADYAVIGDLHEVVPAISAEITEGEGDIGSLIAGLLLAAAVAVSAALFATRVRFLVGLLRAAAPVDARGRCAPPRAQRGDDRARPAQAAPALRPRADPRIHLLGLPGAGARRS